MAWLITGASGFIGSRVVQKLPKTEVVLHIHGEQEKDKKQAEKFRASGFSVFEGDLTKKETLQNIPTGLSGIVHTANIAGGNDARLLQANPGTTRLVGQAAKQHKVGTVVYLSSVAVYGETPVEGAAENFRPSPNTLYGESKLAAEEILKLAVEKRDISSAVILRLNSVYGPGQEKGFIYHHISNITNRGYFQIDGMGNQVRQPVFVDDVVDIIAKFIKLIKNPLSGFEIFNVA
ncbi:MAG: SDR family oxidoreductase, partial [Candidatus Doudnabacteria bacterium]|nr:SDR family oxidoreductase [Candidatus Doudnabacteria bacterium]